MTRVAVPGPLWAALEGSHPAGGLPGWLTGRTPCCGTPGGHLELEPDQVEQLLDLVALAWWEAVAAGDDGVLARACAAFLGAPASTDASG